MLSTCPFVTNLLLALCNSKVKGHDLTGEVARACAHIIDAVKYLSECQRSVKTGVEGITSLVPIPVRVWARD